MKTEYVGAEREDHPRLLDIVRTIENCKAVPFEEVSGDIGAVCFSERGYLLGQWPTKRFIFYDSPFVYHVEDFKLLSDPTKRTKITRIASERVYSLEGGDAFEVPYHITNFFRSLIGKTKIPPTIDTHCFDISLQEGYEENILPVSARKPTIVIPKGFEAYSELKTLIEKLVGK